MSHPFVLDASVFLNACIPTETGHAASRKFLQHLTGEGIPILAPTLLLPEVAATISRGQDNPGLAEQFYTSLTHLTHLTLVPLDDRLALMASSIAAHNRLRGSDAVYVAVAIRFGCPLVTLDREQYQRAAMVISTRYPSEAL